MPRKNASNAERRTARVCWATVMKHNEKMLLLKSATALAVIGLLSLGVLFRAPDSPGIAVPLEPEPSQSAPEAAALPPAPPTAPAVRPPAGDPEADVQRLAEAALDRDPNQALALLAEGDDRFPRGRLADERQLLRLRAMVNLNQIAEARVAATQYLELNPRSPIGRQIYRLLGIHAPPELPSPN